MVHGQVRQQYPTSCACAHSSLKHSLYVRAMVGHTSARFSRESEDLKNNSGSRRVAIQLAAGVPCMTVRPTCCVSLLLLPPCSLWGPHSVQPYAQSEWQSAAVLPAPASQTKPKTQPRPPPALVCSRRGARCSEQAAPPLFWDFFLLPRTLDDRAALGGMALSPFRGQAGRLRLCTVSLNLLKFRLRRRRVH